MAKNDFAPASNDAYTGMLSISLVALIGAAVLLYLDYSQYPDTKPPQLVRTPPAVKFDAGVNPVPLPKPDQPKEEPKEKAEPKADDKGEPKDKMEAKEKADAK